jgi:hypothetical protein
MNDLIAFSEIYWGWMKGPESWILEVLNMIKSEKCPYFAWGLGWKWSDLFQINHIWYIWFHKIQGEKDRQRITTQQYTTCPGFGSFSPQSLDILDRIKPGRFLSNFPMLFGELPQFGQTQRFDVPFGKLT